MLHGAMLTGRESLVHLIGRRRSTPLSAHLAVVLSRPLAPPPTQTPSYPPVLFYPCHLSHAYCSSDFLQADNTSAGMGEAEGEAATVAPSLSGGSAGSEQVTCPVCPEFIPGSDYCINGSTPTSSPESVEHSLLL
ncbi:hypothetical protein D1007_15301 [Hordeum vulgare]|nr:hypothetical protein D1007_15301 [Hordeum vulgare]